MRRKSTDSLLDTQVFFGCKSMRLVPALCNATSKSLPWQESLSQSTTLLMETLLIAILDIAVNNPMHMVHRLLILLDQVRFLDDMYNKSCTERLDGRLKSRFENWLELQRNLWIITLSSCWTLKKKEQTKRNKNSEGWLGLAQNTAWKY